MGICRTPLDGVSAYAAISGDIHRANLQLYRADSAGNEIPVWCCECLACTHVHDLPVACFRSQHTCYKSHLAHTVEAAEVEEP